MEEVWKDIPGYEGEYQASTEGRVRSIDHFVRGVCHYTGKDFYRQVKGRIIKPGRFCKSGHVSVVLRRGTNGIPVHQLIMKLLLVQHQQGWKFSTIMEYQLTTGYQTYDTGREPRTFWMFIDKVANGENYLPTMLAQ